MENLNVEQTQTDTAHPAEAETVVGAQTENVSYGKFKDAAALLKAYNSLQAEFTKRCQRLKELEEASAADKAAVENPAAPTEAAPAEVRGITDEEKENFLRDYLKTVLDAKPKAIVLDGGGVGIKTPSAKPSTVEAAGKLAKEFFG